jgi:molybdopterin/thiamine biosynthesis adenylyltransferase
METEQQRVKDIILDLARGEDVGHKMVFDPRTKCVRAIPNYERDPDGTIEVTPEDVTFSGITHDYKTESERIVISGELLKERAPASGQSDLRLVCRDEGEVYSLLYEKHSQAVVPGSLYSTDDQGDVSVSAFGKEEDRIRIVQQTCENSEKPVPADSLKITGFVLRKTNWKKVPVVVLPIKDEIFSRIHGLFETDAIADKNILIGGVGTVGSSIATDFASSGANHFFLIDPDRVEIANISRHVAGLSDVGRYKTKVVAEKIREKNPYATIQTLEEEISWDNGETVRKSVRESDLCICAIDSKPAKLLFNRICVEEKKTCIFAGLFPNAHGGQIFFNKSNTSACYQCFCMNLPEQPKGEEISIREQEPGAARFGYGRNVGEPGLSTDIAPISTMVVKLGLQVLLKGTKTTLRSLDDDLVAPWFLWLNRRQKGTQYENLEPLEFNVGGMHILRWYGIDFKRDPNCPVCGNFEEYLIKQAGFEGASVQTDGL